jgi:hypothetical protein
MDRNDILNMIETFFDTGVIIRPTSSPIILALRDIERSNWRKSRQASMTAIELNCKKRDITPQQLIAKIQTLGSDKFSKQDNIMMGLWSFWNGELEAEKEYNEALKAGATEGILPIKIGERGRYTICCCGNDETSLRLPIHNEIELTIYEHNVWTCPRCDKVWALRNMAAVDMEDDNVE